MKEVDELLGMFAPEEKWLEETKAWYGKVFRGEAVERLLLSTTGPAPRPNKFNMKEQLENPEAMLYESLRGMVAAANSRSASLPTLRANLGTGFIASLFGIEQVIFTDKMPWPQGHVSKTDLAKLSPADFVEVVDKGLLPKARAIYEFYISRLGTGRYCFLPDTQGVLDIAHIVAGDELFLALKDDPGFVHHLMELCLQAYVSVTKTMKRVIGEPLDSGMHWGMALVNGGVRYCMDTTTLLSPKDIEQFEIPYLRRALTAFGGGWVHFCGYAPHLLDLLAEVPEVRAVNANYMKSRPFDYERDVKALQRTGKCFLGGPMRREEEAVKDFFLRVLRPLSGRQGLSFGFSDGTSAPQALMDLWYEAQEEVFGGNS